MKTPKEDDYSNRPSRLNKLLGYRFNYFCHHFWGKSNFRMPTAISCVNCVSLRGSHLHCATALNAQSRNNGWPLMTFASTTLPSRASIHTRISTTPVALTPTGMTGFTFLVAVFSRTLVETLITGRPLKLGADCGA